MDSIKLFAAQQGRRVVILFNNGLHGWHLEDQTAYKVAYERMVTWLLEEFAGVPLILVLTTHFGEKGNISLARTILRGVDEVIG